MNSSRLNILPDERFAEMRPELRARLLSVADAITPERFVSLCDGMVNYLLEQGRMALSADGALVWLLDPEQENLVPSYGLGESSQKLVLNHVQPLREGIVSMVMQSEQPFLENEVYKNEKHSKLVDQKLRQRTYAMVVVPFYFIKACRGVLSYVQVTEPGQEDAPPRGFGADDLITLQRTGAIITELIDYRILRETLSW